jgi:hypothetical protein
MLAVKLGDFMKSQIKFDEQNNRKIPQFCQAFFPEIFSMTKGCAEYRPGGPWENRPAKAKTPGIDRNRRGP